MLLKIMDQIVVVSSASGWGFRLPVSLVLVPGSAFLL